MLFIRARLLKGNSLNSKYYLRIEDMFITLRVLILLVLLL
jgi:hypothetical protein